MIVLSGADLVLPDRVLVRGTLVIDGDRIADIRPGGTGALQSHYIVPGFIDVHVHGVDGVDSLDEIAAGNAIQSIAARLPRYGVTAFCPTTVACRPDALRRVLDQVRDARSVPPAHASRVLPAHLESNFINPVFRGAQPAGCLRAPARIPPLSAWSESATAAASAAAAGDDFTSDDILREIERARPDVGIVTVASEIDGGLELIQWLVARRYLVSLGHSAATYEQAIDAIAAGARQATHLFNRMPPLGHRAPGLAGAVLQSDEIAAELICDGFHVHPALVRTTVAAKRPSHIMAITDATAAAGLRRGARASLGGQPITAGEAAAFLADGTVAGSVLTMDRAFRLLVEQIGLSLFDAAAMCATTPARELGLVGCGVIAPEAMADLVVLDARCSVVQTYVGGQLTYSRAA